MTAYGQRPRVAYQGEPGAFSEEAARTYFGSDVLPLPCRSFDDLARSVATGAAAYGMLPVENTVAGAVAPAYDAIAGTQLVVVGEIVCPIRQCLLALPSTTIDSVRRALSHPVALAQCARFFREHPQIEALAVHDTAGAARQVAEVGDRAFAAVAGQLAADRYGLEVIEYDIQDRPDNQTRFFVIALPEAQGQPAPDDALRKTAMLIETENMPGALLSVLAPLAERGINLAHLECRPGDSPWTYRFFLEIEAAADASPAAEALDAIRAHTTAFRVLGSFPAARPLPA